MQKGIRFGEAIKVPYGLWKIKLKDEVKDGKVMRFFAEVCSKETVTVFYLDDGTVNKREMPTVSYGAIPGVPCGNVRGFRGFLRRGDVIDVGSGGTIFDSAVRFGLASGWSEILWLDGGSEEDVVRALREVACNSD